MARVVTRGVVDACPACDSDADAAVVAAAGTVSDVVAPINAGADLPTCAWHLSDRVGAFGAAMTFSEDDLDPDVDPLVDLDAHVNGRWRARTEIPADRGCWDSFTIVAEATLLMQRKIAEEAGRVFGFPEVDARSAVSLDSAQRRFPVLSSRAQRGICIDESGSPAALEMTEGEMTEGGMTEKRLKKGAIAEDGAAEARRAKARSNWQTGGDDSGASRIVGALWRSGMDLDARERAGCEAIADDLAEIDAITTRSSVAALIDAAHARGETLLWSIDVVPDVINPSVMQLHVSPALGTFGLADQPASARGASRRRRLCVAYFGGLLVRAGCALEAARRQSRLAFDLEHALATAMPSATTRDVATLHRPIDWAQLRDELHPLSLEACLAAAEIAQPATLSLPAPTFHATVAQLLEDRPIAQWQAWLRVRLLDAAAPELSSTLSRWHHRFHGRALRGLRVQPPPWKQVLAVIDHVAPDAMAQLYVARHVSPDTAPRMQALFDALRRALRARIVGATWLGDVARTRAVEKADAMRARLVAPDRWPDWRDVELGAADFYASLRTLRAEALQRRLRKLADPMDGNEVPIGLHADAWSMPAHRVNARYDPQTNCIEVPAGILQPPFFEPHASRASQYGAIGAVMAHEMSHGFDDQGRRFDAAGRLDDGWPAADVAAFDRRADAVADWFDRLPDGVGGRVDGRRTLGENLADVTGLAVAWDAYVAERGEGGDIDVDARRFFAAWAVMWRQLLTLAEAERRAALDHHAPAALRANVASAGLQGFWTAFGSSKEFAGGGPGVW